MRGQRGGPSASWAARWWGWVRRPSLRSRQGRIPEEPQWCRLWMVGRTGVPAEREGAVHEGLVAADRGRGADLEVGPAEFVLDLFVALLDPVPDPVEAYHFGQVCRLVGGVAGVMGPAGA